MRPAATGLRAATLLATALTAVACGGAATAGPTSPTASARPTAGLATTAPAASPGAVIAPYGGVFGSASAFALDVRSAPVASGSKAMVANLDDQVTNAYGGVAAFNAHSYDTSFVTAAADTPTTDVAYVDCQHKGYEPTGLAGQFANVPIPAGAVPSTGTDSEISVYQASTDRLWELWIAKHGASGWSACYGGRMDHVSRSPGFFTGGFGAAATGLATAAGMIGITEVRRGTIPHALGLAIIAPATADRFSYPAQRSDGYSTAAGAIPEGTRLRLDPGVDVDSIAGLTPIGRMVAHAAQTYGFIVTDKSGAVAVDAESGAAEEAVTGTDPWVALEGGVPDYQQLQGFPWSRLQVLPAGYGQP